jgi:Flp pilus assembly pilin Flp
MSTELSNTALDTEDVQTGFAALSHRVRQAVRSFYKDEDGLSTVEMLLLLFIGLVIVIAIIKFVFPNVWNVIKNQINNLLGYGNNQTT